MLVAVCWLDHGTGAFGCGCWLLVAGCWFDHGTGAFAPEHENRAMRLNLLTQIGDAEKDRRTQASLAPALLHITILRITPHRPDTKCRVAASRKYTKTHQRAKTKHNMRRECEVRGAGCAAQIEDPLKRGCEHRRGGGLSKEPGVPTVFATEARRTKLTGC